MTAARSPDRDDDSRRLVSAAALSVELNRNGSLRRFDGGAVSLLLFPGSELEGGLINLYLRRRAVGQPWKWNPLFGPGSDARFAVDPVAREAIATCAWAQLECSARLVLAADVPAWFWHVHLENTGSETLELDLTYTHDVALAPYGAIRNNEYFVSQYIDHTPLRHATQGVMLASRQNQPVDGRHPWCMIGSLRTGATFATDALQFYGLARRAGSAPQGLEGELSGHRLQHEHSLAVIRDAPLRIEAGAGVDAGFFGLYAADHPAASSEADLAQVAAVLSLPEARSRAPAPARAQAPASAPAQAVTRANAATLFSSAPLLSVRELAMTDLQRLFPRPWRHEERDAAGSLLSFFYGLDRHVVLRGKELQVLRPHGQLLRTGRHITPAEAALTSTAWMSGVFHSLVTQGHVNINRFLSTVRGYLGLFRAHGQRVFVELEGEWQLLDVPSVFEMSPLSCRWIYGHAQGLIELCATAHSDPDALSLSVRIEGKPTRWLISHHLALAGDDGAARTMPHWERDRDGITVTPPGGSELAQRFPNGRFRIAVSAGGALERVGSDELLFADGRSRGEPYLCLLIDRTEHFALSLTGELITQETQAPLLLPQSLLEPRLPLQPPAASALTRAAARLAELVPWLAQNALVHYLAPRGLEQYSGGGWGTRDVCQGPIEMLLALGQLEPIRHVLRRVMAAQNADGDWPQWFMFFERERHIRAGDSHGDVVLWPLVVLAQYLTASGDATLLQEQVPFFDARAAELGERATVWEHAQRALALSSRRVIPGTALAAYGHGDWNDSLQPADPALRERLCSAWTVTLQVQALASLARALHLVGRPRDAQTLEQQAERVRQDFQRLLIVDGVLAGYALFGERGAVRYLLHPRDDRTGVRYSALAMIHAVLEDLFTPEQARAHLLLIETQLSGPDGVRLFDRPLPYHGGTQQLFQRAETATFFGREIGLMYTHAHLRYAQALAHLGEAERFFHALSQANPIAIRDLVASATLRQANCYYSSSDAAFADRYQASEEYERVRRGTVALDGGWRVYSSGAGIALSLIMRHLLGVGPAAGGLRLDPVIPSALDGLAVEMTLLQREVELRYRIGAAGCGVQSVQLNGAALPFTREANPYRLGAVVLAGATLQQRLVNGRNRLTIELG